MADYIKREDALKAMEWKWAGKAAFDAVKEIPAVDVAEVKHGKWEKQIQCSECGWYFEDDVLIEPIMVFFNYCPNCGARMDGE